MLTNATILRITPPNAPTTGGEVTYTPAVGELTPPLRCAEVRVNRQHRLTLGAIIATSTAMIRVSLDELINRNLTIEEGYQVQVRLDRFTATKTFLVDYAQTAVKSGVSSVQAFVHES